MHNNNKIITLVATGFCILIYQACGGSGYQTVTSSGGPATPAASPTPIASTPTPTPPPTLAMQMAAAESTAQNNTQCIAIQPFYWEVGNATQMQDSGSVGASAPTQSTSMSIASASKWLYSSFVVQQLGVSGLDAKLDIPFLNFTSGYSQFGSGAGPGVCKQTDTIQDCLNRNNSTQDPTTIGVFHYDSGHMEVHAASRMNLGVDGDGPLTTTILATDMGTMSGSLYTQPLMAGGVGTSPGAYAIFLRKLLSGSLSMSGILQNESAYKVCTTPGCAGPTSYSPLTAATSESWSYSIGHWYEDDPTYGDKAHSSAGAYGFYPWVDSTLSVYGILARDTGPTQNFEGFRSALCGRLIRQAWRTGVAVTDTLPTP